MNVNYNDDKLRVRIWTVCKREGKQYSVFSHEWKSIMKNYNNEEITDSTEYIYEYE